MVTLYCAVVGVQGYAFPIDIAASQSVGDLKDAIQKKKSNDFKDIDADKLQLFLARTEGGAWLADEANLDNMLQNQVDTSKMKMLRGSWKLNKPDLFGPDVSLGKGVIHVLVVVPPREEMLATGLRDDLGELVEARFIKVLKERDEKVSAYSFSELNTATEERILKKMRLDVDYIDFQEPVDTSVVSYCWLDIAEGEAAQRTRYMEYLKTHFKITSKGQELIFLDVTGDKTALTIHDRRLPFQMNGTADVLLVDRRSTTHLEPLAGVRIVIELKKRVESQHRPQAFGQLVAASLKAPLNCTPIGLLTDLNDHWHFSWFSAKGVVAHLRIRHPKNALTFMAAAVADTASSKPFHVPFIDQPLTKYKVDDFLPMPDDGAAEMMERYELMADVVEPEFLMARRMEYAQHLVQSMPMYAHLYT